MKTIEKYKKELLDKRAEESNTCDLNEFAIGVNRAFEIMEQFRKEAMEESYVSGFLEKCGRFYISNKPDEEIAEDFFQEWYNNQIKES